MLCPDCRKEGIETHYGCFCENCGGVVNEGVNGGLLFRHVATVKREADGHFFLIMYDASTSDYCVSHPRPAPVEVACIHCGRKTPTDPAAAKRAAELGMVARPPILTRHGSLDGVIAYINPIARGPKGPDGEPPPFPTLAASPHATKEERALINV